MKFLLLLLLLCVTFFNTACAPIKGYPGPERPDQELAILEWELDSQNIEVANATTAGVEFSSSGIKLLPGPNRLSFGVTVKGYRHSCDTYGDMNYSSYEDCMDDVDKGKKKSCNCWDYLTVRRKCYRTGYDGACSGDYQTKIGMKYQIRVRPYGDAADSRVVETASGAVVGEMRCDVFGDHEIEEDEYVGTGRYTANRNGISSCY